MTDPLVNQAYTVAPPLAWYNAANGEVADVCNGMPGYSVDSSGNSLLVQVRL